MRNHRQKIDELNIEGFDFKNGFKCSDAHKIDKMNNLSKSTFEINFHQDKNKWKLGLIPLEMSKNDSDRVVDHLIYKNLYVPNKI